MAGKRLSHLIGRHARHVHLFFHLGLIRLVVIPRQYHGATLEDVRGRMGSGFGMTGPHLLDSRDHMLRRVDPRLQSRILLGITAAFERSQVRPPLANEAKRLGRPHVSVKGITDSTRLLIRHPGACPSHNRQWFVHPLLQDVAIGVQIDLLAVPCLTRQSGKF